jgi:uncharacterized protein (DUF362 family)/Pyruvate/2-oxoacid:ferredoxin oxidoreductase delta subunit
MTAVTFAACDSYPQAQAAVRRALDLAGGPGRFFKPGLRVLIKPNFLSDATPDQAITTHPEIARAVIRLAREEGAIPCVADSPAGALRIQAVWERTGFRALCGEEQVPLLNLEQAGSRSFTFNGVSFAIAKPVLEADLVVNLPKVKTHTLTMFTGAVKNLYGTLPGFQKATLHKIFPTADEMGRFLAHLVDLVKPGLSIADAVIGMEGNGPSGGTPVKLGFVAASTDPVALDAALCRVLGVPLGVVPWFRHLPQDRAEAIDLTGDVPAPGSLKLALPSNWKSRLIPRPLIRLLAPLFWIRPEIDSNRCIRCGRCARACPASALAFEKDRLPVLDGRRCIGCCCCHESCPVKAMRMVESPFMRRISRGRLVST